VFNFIGTLIPFLVLLSSSVRHSAMALQAGDGPPAYGSLRWQAAQAKAKGQTSVNVFTFADGVGGAGGVEDAFDYFTVVEATPLSSVVETRTYDINTWYKFRIISLLSRATKCAAPCVAPPDAPPGLLPVARNEIAVPVAGGTATVDGIVITNGSYWPTFEMGCKYLLFISTGPKGGTVAFLSAGPSAAYKVDARGSIIRLSDQRTRLMDEITAHQYVDRLREHIQAHQNR
jgi:hypothetical protein